MAYPFDHVETHLPDLKTKTIVFDVRERIFVRLTTNCFISYFFLPSQDLEHNSSNT